MKKIALLVVFCANIIKAQSPFELWGVNDAGGNGYGSIYKVDSTNNIVVLNSYENYKSGVKPIGKLCIASNNKAYGFTEKGGAYDAGIIFEYDLQTNAYVKKFDFGEQGIFNFTSYNYSDPTLVENDSKLYGVATKSNNIVIYELDIITGITSIKMSFANGTGPSNNFLKATNGKFYGLGVFMTGPSIFEYDPSTNIINIKASCNYPCGTNSFIEGSPNKFYTTTNNNNSYYPLNKIIMYDAIADTVGLSYTMNVGSSPLGGMCKGNNGKLYGIIDFSNMSTGVHSKILFSFDDITNTYDSLLIIPGAIKEGLVSESNKLLCIGYAGVNDLGSIYDYDILNNTIMLKQTLANTHGFSVDGIFCLSPVSAGNYIGLSLLTITPPSLGSQQTVPEYEGGLIFNYNNNTSVFSEKIVLQDRFDGANPTTNLFDNGDGLDIYMEPVEKGELTTLVVYLK